MQRSHGDERQSGGLPSSQGWRISSWRVEAANVSRSSKKLGKAVPGGVFDQDRDVVADRSTHLCVGQTHSRRYHFDAELWEAVGQPLLNFPQRSGFILRVHRASVISGRGVSKRTGH